MHRGLLRRRPARQRRGVIRDRLQLGKRGVGLERADHLRELLQKLRNVGKGGAGIIDPIFVAGNLLIQIGINRLFQIVKLVMGQNQRQIRRGNFLLKLLVLN